MTRPLIESKSKFMKEIFMHRQPNSDARVDGIIYCYIDMEYRCKLWERYNRLHNCKFSGERFAI